MFLRITFEQKMVIFVVNAYVIDPAQLFCFELIFSEAY